MIDLKLTNEEAAELQNVLTSYVSELRMEIADTDKYEFREGLKNKEKFLKDLIGRLRGNH
jgi:LPS O-antigen subunit length determinant protein (WzzB/FepE family)